MASIFRLLLVGLLAMSGAVCAEVYVPRAQQVIDNVYVLVGPIDERTYDNQALNNNQAFIVTPKGVVLFDTGASREGARLIEAAIRAVTWQPVRWVINSGSQDHRWLGNAYFRERGASIIAFDATVDTQRRFAAQHLARLRNILKERLEGTEPAYADRMLSGDQATLELGGELFQVMRTDAHFPGDAMIWLPRLRTVFTGDLVYHDRMLGVHDWSDPLAGQAAYRRMRALSPTHMTVIPGHGVVGDLAKADRDTGGYYDFLIDVVGKAASDMEPLSDVIEANAQRPEFMHLKHYDSWHRTNMNRTYLRMEGR